MLGSLPTRRRRQSLAVHQRAELVVGQQSGDMGVLPRLRESKTRAYDARVREDHFDFLPRLCRGASLLLCEQAVELAGRRLVATPRGDARTRHRGEPELASIAYHVGGGMSGLRAALPSWRLTRSPCGVASRSAI
jgi:hypothetical protein